jgi:hypothetical protein
VRRSRKFEEELAVRKRPSAPVDGVTGEHGLAEETLRLQERVGNATTTELIARSALQRDTAGTEAAPAKDGEEEKGVVYTMTMADVGTFDVLSWSLSTTSGDSGGQAGPGKRR